MRIIARFAGPNGEIRILEERSTGMRTYCEGGVYQSEVRAGGETGIDYVRLMADLIAGSGNVLLIGCGGGSLGGMLHRRGSSVTVIDVNPLSFQLARTFFWMPSGIECVTVDMRDFVRRETRTFDGMGIDVGGPRFSYEKVLDPETVANIRRLLCAGGRITVNISCEAKDDPIPGRIADIFAAEGLEVWFFKEDVKLEELNSVILASARAESHTELAAIAGPHWTLAQLAEWRPPQSVPRTRRQTAGV